MDDDLYIRFENRFRGSREVIKARVKVYLPIIEPLKAIYPDSLIVDVGCGRGEWLELLNENGWQAIGVDTNRSMVDLCRELGLNAVAGDAIEYLSTVKSESVSVISGFHIVEHLPFDLLVRLVQEAHRVLLPGGILILETPNPENYQVSAINFYIDPTHRNPLPPSLMQFLAEDSGFSKSVILRLNGPEQPGFPDTSWALLAHPDYSLVAQKQKSADMTAFQYFDSMRSEHVDFLAILNNNVSHFRSELKSELKRELNGVRSELNRVKNELDEVKSELSEIRASYPWRVYAALRKFKDNDKARRMLDVLNLLFPLNTLPKRATLKITRLSKESRHKVIQRVKKLIYRTAPTEADFSMAEKQTPMSPEVRAIHMDLVNTMRETDSKKRNPLDIQDG